MSHKNNNSNRKPTCEAEVHARREGRYVRAKTWSPNGDRKCKKRRRREGKTQIRNCV